MKIRNTQKSDGKVDMQMTPMIDVVFNLLAFFILSFKVTVPEGDFAIKMPRSAPPQTVVDENLTPPIKIRLQVGADGQLGAITLNDQPMGSFRAMRDKVINIVGQNTGPNSLAASTEVDLDCDYKLPYKYVMEAITTISGAPTADGQYAKLIEKIKFAPPKKPPE